VLDVAAGSHTIVVDDPFHPSSYELRLAAKPGAKYALEVSPRYEVMVGAVFGVAGMLAEAATSEEGKGGTFRVRVVEPST
jgi:hypothetical protein